MITANTWGPTRRLDAVVAASFLASGILIAAIPRFLRAEFAATRSQTGLATTGFFLAALFFRPFVGRGIERYGRSVFLRWAMFATGVLSIAFEFVDSIVTVGLVRILQGAAGAAFYTAALTTATDLAAPDKRAAAVARLSVNVYLGFTIGPLIADFLIRGPGYKTVWALIIALYFVAFALSWFVPETHKPLAVSSLSAIKLTVHGDVGANRSPASRKLSAMFPKAALIPGIAMFATALTFSTVTVFTPDYADNMGIARPGMLLAFYAIAVLIVRVVASPIVDRRNAYVVVIPAMVVAGIALAVMATSRSVIMSFAGITLAGLGAGATFPALSSMVVQGVETAKRATALSAFLMFNDLGQASAGPVVGFVSDSFGWRWVFGVPALATLGALSVLLVARRGTRALAVA